MARPRGRARRPRLAPRRPALFLLGLLAVGTAGCCACRGGGAGAPPPGEPPAPRAPATARPAPATQPTTAAQPDPRPPTDAPPAEVRALLQRLFTALAEEQREALPRLCAGAALDQINAAYGAMLGQFGRRLLAGGVRWEPAGPNAYRAVVVPARRSAGDLDDGESFRVAQAGGRWMVVEMLLGD